MITHANNDPEDDGPIITPDESECPDITYGIQPVDNDHDIQWD